MTYLTDKLNRLESVPDKLILSTEGALPSLYRELLKLLNLETDGDDIIRSAANISRIDQIINDYRATVYSSSYAKAVKTYSDEFAKQKELNDQLIESLGFETSATRSAIGAADFVLATTRRSAVEILIGDASLESRFFGIIKSTLLESVNTASTYTSMVDRLSTVVLGDARREGQLLNWVKQVAHDSFAISDRSYTHTAGEELGVEWYRYMGGIIKDTRPFCDERNGKYYHVSEVQAWPTTAGNWAGRMPNTDSTTIFDKCGGYRCQHSLVMVSEFVVPEEVIQRIYPDRKK